jgi:hypothetical protein
VIEALPASADAGDVVECLNCGQRCDLPEAECPRCTYVGWAWIGDLGDALRRTLRERTLTTRRLRSAV